MRVCPVRPHRIGPVFIAIVALSTSALGQQPAPVSDPVGNWKAVFTGPIGPRPKMVDAITFEIRKTDGGYSGTARASEWPGDLDVTGITLTGNRLGFTGTGRIGWGTSVGGVHTDHCCPKLVFAGTIDGNRMALTLTWTSTEPNPDARDLPMEAMRISRTP